MDLKNLSSNWRKLQETLRKDTISGSTSTKHKTPGRIAQYGVKRRRTAEASLGNTAHNLERKTVKKRKMSETNGHKSDKEAGRRTSTTSSGRDSPSSAKENRSRAKANGGLSSEYVLLYLYLAFCLVPC